MPRADRIYLARLAAMSLFLAWPGVAGCAEDHDRDAPIATDVEGVEIVEAFPGLRFERPVFLTHAGDGSARVFVVEQPGRVQAITRAPGGARASVFLDISERVNDSGNEEGLLGLAFHPDYAENGSFFVDYTAAKPRRTVISRFRVSSVDAGRADPGSEEILLEIAQPYGNHNGGMLLFGNDGHLYIGMGDGGSAGDPQRHGQNPETLLGAMLRIDVDRPQDGRPYGIPSDNPYANGGEDERGGQGQPEIFAIGLRNPWRFSEDPATGKIWVGDVGQNSREEISIVERGGNYGWNLREGTRPYGGEHASTDFADPVIDYGRDLGFCVTGGYVYRGSNIEALAGRYVYGDFGSGRIWALDYRNGRVQSNRQIARTPFQIASFGVDQDGELYLTDLRGSIHRFRAPRP